MTEALRVARASIANISTGRLEEALNRLESVAHRYPQEARAIEDELSRRTHRGIQ